MLLVGRFVLVVGQVSDFNVLEGEYNEGQLSLIAQNIVDDYALEKT